VVRLRIDPIIRGRPVRPVDFAAVDDSLSRIVGSGVKLGAARSLASAAARARTRESRHHGVGSVDSS
jgi:hypothetical protein